MSYTRVHTRIIEAQLALYAIHVAIVAGDNRQYDRILYRYRVYGFIKWHGIAIGRTVCRGVRCSTPKNIIIQSYIVDTRISCDDIHIVFFIAHIIITHTLVYIRI